MSWFSGLMSSEFVQHNSPTLLAATVILVPAAFFFFYRKYSQRTTYVSVEDNEILKAKMEAARLKQQEKYDQYIKENGEELKEKNEELENELKRSSTTKVWKDNDDSGESLFGNQDYLPLMGGGGSTGKSYRPAKKRPCGPCGGGGCG